jgi:hypothetical protein
MNNAIADREQLRFKPEATYGVIATTGNHYALRLKSEDLAYDLKTDQSQEITGDRQVQDQIVVGAAAAGSVPFEWSYGEHDWLVEAGLATTISNVVGTNGEASITATFTTTSLTAGAGTPFTAVEVGQYIGVAGAAQTGNNGVFGPVSAFTSTSVTFGSGVFTAETGTTGVKARGARFKNGATLKSFSIERYLQDIAKFETFRGMAVDTFNLDFTPGAILAGAFAFMGKDALPIAGATALPGSTTASLTNTVMNSVNNISAITENGTVFANTFVKSLKIQIKNNMRGLEALGVLGNAGVALGDFDCECSFDIYLDPTDAVGIYNAYLANSVRSFSFRATDSAGNVYLVSFPRIKYSTARRPNPGKNQDVMLSASFQAIKDPTTGKTLIIDRMGSAITPWA